MSSTRNPKFEFRVNNVLTDATTAVLSDSTGTYGVKRNDTNGVVVAAGTALDHIGTGLYEKSFTAPVDTVGYTAWAKFTYVGESGNTDTVYAERDFAANDAITTIVSQTDILEWLALTNRVNARESAWLNKFHGRIERMIMNHLGYDPRQQEYTHIIPTADSFRPNDPFIRDFDVQANRLMSDWPQRGEGANMLVLPVKPVRSITNLWENRTAWGGQAEGDFSDTMKLTQGVDFNIDFEDQDAGNILIGLSKSGIIKRMYMSWPARARTVKVQYTAGYASDELSVNGIAGDIGMAVCITVQHWFARRGRDQGQISSESLGGRSVTFADAAPTNIPKDAKLMLHSYMSYARLL